MGDSAYSFSLTTFSRTGKLLPIEYALNAVANGRTALGICTASGVVLATDKKLPLLVDGTHVHKIEAIHETAGVCFAGLGPDSRVLGTFPNQTYQPNKHPSKCWVFFRRARAFWMLPIGRMGLLWSNVGWLVGVLR